MTEPLKAYILAHSGSPNVFQGDLPRELQCAIPYSLMTLWELLLF